MHLNDDGDDSSSSISANSKVKSTVQHDGSLAMNMNVKRKTDLFAKQQTTAINPDADDGSFK